MLEATNYMLSSQSSANQSRVTANTLLFNSWLRRFWRAKGGNKMENIPAPSFIYERMPHMENTSEAIRNMWTGPHKTVLVPPRQRCLLQHPHSSKPKSKNGISPLLPCRNISRLGDRDSECRASKMFGGVHPTLRHNRLEIALPKKPLVSPRFTLLAVPPDWDSQSVNIHSPKTNEISVSGSRV